MTMAPHIQTDESRPISLSICAALLLYWLSRFLANGCYLLADKSRRTIERHPFDRLFSIESTIQQAAGMRLIDRRFAPTGNQGLER